MNRRGAERLVVPSAVVFSVALAVSFVLHANLYAGLGAVRLPSPDRGLAPSEVAIELVTTPASPAAPAAEPAPPGLRENEPAEAPPARERRTSARPPRPVRRAEPTQPPEAAPEPTAEADPARAPTAPEIPPADDRRSIVQPNETPTEPPPEARFLADQARRVEEETVAALRNAQRDDPDPQASAETQPSETAPEGNATEELSAELRDRSGDDRRDPTPEELESEATAAVAATTPSPTEGTHAGQAGDDARAREERAHVEGAAASERGTTPQRVAVSDGFGSFVVEVPGNTTAAAGRGSTGRGRAARTTPGAAAGSDRLEGPDGPRLGLSYAEFEGVFGEETLATQRTARIEQRRSTSRGAARAREWTAFRAAIENYLPEVRVGNQTALNAAASPFATFLSDMHRRIHRQFAENYIAGLGVGGADGQDDPSLRTTLEISVNANGTLHRVGIVRSSGNTLFDFGAFTSVWRAQPLPRPPEAILSGDGRAWLRWHFDRGPRHCGTWNAEPYILRNSPDPIDEGEPPG